MKNLNHRIMQGITVLAYFSLIALTGCATPLPVSDLQAGKPLEEVKKLILATPRAVTTFPAPHDSAEQMKVLEYDLARPNTNDYRPFPHWILFYNDKLLAYGMGYTNNAEFFVNQSFLDSLVKEKKIKQGDAERRIYSKYISLFGEPHPLIAEYTTYRIMMADKLDAGKIERAELDHLLSKKWAEVSAKLEQVQMQHASIQAQQNAASAAQGQALTQLGLGLMQMGQPQIPQTNTYTITPLGRGWIMQGR